MRKSTTSVGIRRVTQSGSQMDTDLVATEEPLEIRIDGRSVAITMRTPGHDAELTAGFLVQVLAQVDAVADKTQLDFISKKLWLAGARVRQDAVGGVRSWSSRASHS